MRDQIRPAGRVSRLFTHFSGAIGLCAAFAAAAAALALALPVASASAAEACPNAQAREQSNVNETTGKPYSLQLPDCRAYELVSPPNTEGWSVPGFHGGAARYLDMVTPNATVLFVSQATPPGTGALPDGRGFDTFRSRRTPSGWTTEDVLPSSQPLSGKQLWGASANGNRVLLNTNVPLSPEDLNNPEHNPLGGYDLYIVGEGGTPEFVSHGSYPNTHQVEKTVPEAAFYNADLSAVGFISKFPLSLEYTTYTETANIFKCYIWADVGSRLAQLAYKPTEKLGKEHCEYFAVAADGTSVYEADHHIYDGSNKKRVNIGGPTPGAAQFDAISPNGEIVYITTTDKLLPNADAGADLYAVNLAMLEEGGSVVGHTAVVTCLSCEAAGTPNGGSVSWVGQSEDGSHVFFRLANGDLYEHDASGSSLLAPAADGLSGLVFSQNGQHAIGLTSQALSAADTNGAADIYELTQGESPKLITGGEGTAIYTPVAVSDSGQRVLYEEKQTTTPAEAQIEEFSEGATARISPEGSKEYSVMGTAGGELENVFFDSHVALVPADLNAGTRDIYDARTDGGFPPCTAGNPLPPPGQESCAPPTSTPNPQPPVPAALGANLAPSTLTVPALPADTSHPAAQHRGNKHHGKGCRARFKHVKNQKKRRRKIRRCLRHRHRHRGKASRHRGRRHANHGRGK